MEPNTPNINILPQYNHDQELQDFDNTKLGVKGLVDSGITKIPPIFHHPPDTLFYPTNRINQQLDLSDPNHDLGLIPVIDLSSSKPELVNLIRDASAKVGFFQVINHGISVSFLDRLIEGVKAFHELPPQEKIAYYRRDTTNCDSGGVGFYSNFDLFESDAASWRDTLEVRLENFDPKFLPHVCR